MGASDFDLSFPRDKMRAAVSHRVVSDVADLFSKDRIERAAKLCERKRLARDLHDGVLQSLTAAAFQLEAMTSLVDRDPGTARTRLREIQELILQEQRALRKWIEDTKQRSVASTASQVNLAAALTKLCRRISRWGPHVQLAVTNSEGIARELADQVYRITEESLNNVARHAHARTASVEVHVVRDRVRIVVDDDGCGFPFRGRYDLRTLNLRQLGPVSLKERVASLGGQLVVTSTLSGSRLEFTLPVGRQAPLSEKSIARRA